MGSGWLTFFGLHNKMVLARIAEKNHFNGARNPRAQFRKEMSAERICSMPASASRSRASSIARWASAMASICSWSSAWMS